MFIYQENDHLFVRFGNSTLPYSVTGGTPDVEIYEESENSHVIKLDGVTVQKSSTNNEDDPEEE